MELKFGKNKGKQIHECDTAYLMWLAENTDTNDPKYGKNNQALVDECNRVINERADGGVPAKAKKMFGPKPSAPTPQANGTPNTAQIILTRVEALESKLNKVIEILETNFGNQRIAMNDEETGF